MKNIYLYCTLAAVILLCCNCNRKSTQSFKRSPINKISNIVLPITLHQDSLSKLINDRVPKILYNDAQKKNSNSKDLELKFTRTGNLVADFSGKNIFYQSPIKIWGKKKWLLGNVEIQAEINLYFKTELDVSSNWDLNTVTELVKYEWIKKPELILGKMDISLGFLSDLIIKHAKDEVTRKLDGALKENFDLHSTIQDVWSKIQKPVKAIQAHGVWLDLDPKSVGLMPFTKKEKWIKTGLQLQSMFKAYIADDPSLDTIQKNIAPLPMD